MDLRRWSQTRRGRFRSGIGSTPLTHPQRLPIQLAVLDDRIVAKACLPGVGPEDIALRISGRQLTIATTRLRRDQGAIGDSRTTGGESWYRRVRLPRPVYPDAGQVTFEAGTLTIALPRADLGEIPLTGLPGGQALGRTEIPLRSSAEVMPPSPGPHVTVYRP
jgi:HSP20 family molecular chaperone IbpA